MEEKPYKWFLQEVCNKHISLKILETGICRGTKVIAWYENTLSDEVTLKSIKMQSKTRYLINYFLNQRVPILEEYAPEKLICYLYHKTGKRIVTAREAIELAENQLHGLQVTSVHMAINSNTEIFTLSAINIGSELNTEIFISRFGKYSSQTLKDPAIIEKIIHLLVQISDFIIRITAQEIHEVHLDLLIDNVGSLTIIKITDLKLKTIIMRPGFYRKSSIKLIQRDHSSEESIESIESPYMNKVAFTLHEKEKKPLSLKVPINKPLPKNSHNFLEMIANTIDKDRRKYSVQNYFQKRKEKEIEIERAKEKEKEMEGKLHPLCKRKSFRESRTMKKSLCSLNDLLFYLEKTRPKIWIKDIAEIPITVKNINVNVDKKMPRRRQASANYLTPVSRMSHVNLLISEENRIGKKILLRTHDDRSDRASV